MHGLQQQPCPKQIIAKISTCTSSPKVTLSDLLLKKTNPQQS
jgi:hypothetical protein